MGGFILLFLIIVVLVLVVPAVALAKASQALRAIEELKQRLLMLESRWHGEDVPAERPKVVTEPKPVPRSSHRLPCRRLCLLPQFRRRYLSRNRSCRLKKCTSRPWRRPRAQLIGSNSWGRKCSPGSVALPSSSASPSS